MNLQTVLYIYIDYINIKGVHILRLKNSLRVFIVMVLCLSLIIPSTIAPVFANYKAANAASFPIAKNVSLENPSLVNDTNYSNQQNIITDKGNANFAISEKQGNSNQSVLNTTYLINNNVVKDTDLKINDNKSKDIKIVDTKNP